MGRAELSKLQERVVRFLWQHYSTEKSWPTRKQVLIAFREEDPDLDQDVLTSAGITCDQRSGPNATVSLSFEAAITIPEVEVLLRPLPQLIRLAIERLASSPMGATTGPRHHFTQEDLSRIWGSADRAALAWRVIQDLRLPWLPLSSVQTGRDGVVFAEASIGILRFHGAETIADLQARLRGDHRRDVGAYPHGPHLRILAEAHEYLMRHGDWPVAVPFAISNRSVGYVPDLLQDLEPRFVRKGFGYSEHDRVELTPAAAAVVDASGILCDRLLAVVHSLGALWWDWPEAEPIPLPIVADRASLDLKGIQSIVRYLDRDIACGLTRDGRGELVFYAGEEIRRSVKARTWSDYLDNPRQRDPAVQPFVTDLAFLSERTETLGRTRFDSPAVASDPLPSVESAIHALGIGVLEPTLFSDVGEARRAFSSRAWKAFFVLAGGIAEGILVGILERSPTIAASYFQSAKGFDRAGLRELVRVAAVEGLLNNQTTTLITLVADHRDLIHPIRCRDANLRIDEQSASAAALFLRSLVACLGEAARNGSLNRYELKGRQM